MELFSELPKFDSMIEEDKQILSELVEENNRLKNEVRKLKMEIETATEESGSGRFNSNNLDVLKRLSNLEKIVYGNKDED